MRVPHEVLNAGGVEYAVCGGIALAIHGYPRFTQDIDLLVRGCDLDRAIALAAKRGFTLDGGRMSFGSGTPSSRELRRISESDLRDVLTLDLLVVGPALEETWAGRQVAEWRGQRLWVVSRVGLAHVKRIAGRMQDSVDSHLLEGPSPERVDD